MSFIEDKIKKIVVNRLTVRLVEYLKGKKTVIGAVSFLLWVAIYAMPAFTPQYNFITQYAVMIRDAMQAAGIDLDNELFNAGVGFTLVGLVDKVRRLFKKDK